MRTRGKATNVICGDGSFSFSTNRGEVAGTGQYRQSRPSLDRSVIEGEIRSPEDMQARSVRVHMHDDGDGFYVIT